MNATGLAIHWQCFGSNGQKKADYSRGVLERFTRRAPTDWIMDNKIGGLGDRPNIYIKHIANPRKIHAASSPHYIAYFPFGGYSVDETCKLTRGATPLPVVADKISINHYHSKSLEEFLLRGQRGDAVNFRVAIKRFSESNFLAEDCNEVFDDGILKYRDARAKVYQPPDNSHVDERLLTALERNLSPALKADTPSDFYAGKMETFLTCRAVASYLKMKLKDDKQAKLFEETALKALLKSLDKMSIADASLLIRELPNILNLSYSVVNDIRKGLIQCIPRIMEELRLKRGTWVDFADLDYIYDLLKTGG